MKPKRIHITIYDDIDENTALECVKQVVSMGRVSKNNTLFCFATILETSKFGDIAVFTRDYRENDCFLVCKHQGITKTIKNDKRITKQADLRIP